MSNLIKKNDIVCHFAGVAEPLEYLKKPTKIQLTTIPSLKIIDLCCKF